MHLRSRIPTILLPKRPMRHNRGSQNEAILKRRDTFEGELNCYLPSKEKCWREMQKTSASSFPVTTQRIDLETGVSMQIVASHGPFVLSWTQAHRRGGRL
jgi:hypothetical protein